MVQVHARLFFERFNVFCILCTEFPHYHLFGVHEANKIIPLRCFIRTDIPFNISSMICVSKIDCSVELFTSVLGIILVSTRHRIKSNRSFLFENQAPTISLHDMFAPQAFVQADRKAHERNRLKLKFHCVQFRDVIFFWDITVVNAYATNFLDQLLIGVCFS